MNKLPKEKRDKILLIAVGALAVAAAYWYLVISAQNDALAKLNDSIQNLQDRIHQAERTTRNARAIDANLVDVQRSLARYETAMVPAEQLTGKKWLYDQINDFVQRKHRNVVPTAMSNDPVLGRNSLPLPDFYYNGAAWTVYFRAYYNEFGKFLADFENSFPLLAVQNLSITPLASTLAPAPSAGASSLSGNAENAEGALSAADREKLQIVMRIVALTKPADAPLTR